MRRIRSKDTSPEIAVRRLVYGLGFRYRLHRKDIPGKPDMVFLSRRKAIFIHGCFWHQHPGCKEAHLPKSNTKYWIPKLEHNVQRDKQVMDELAAMGWEVLVIWECELVDRDRLAVKCKISFQMISLDPEGLQKNSQPGNIHNDDRGCSVPGLLVIPISDGGQLTGGMDATPKGHRLSRSMCET